MSSIRRILIASILVSTSALGAQTPPSLVVQVAAVESEEVAPTVAVPGTIYSRNDMQITAGVTGQLIMVAEPGTRVRQGETIAVIDKAPLELQRAEQEVLLKRAEINLKRLDSQLRRQHELSESSLVSEFELEQTEADRDLARNDALITRVRIRQIDDQIRRADVRAPFDGVVIDRARRAGEDVARGEVLGQFTDVRNLEVRAFVPLKHLPRTMVGDSIDVFANGIAHRASIRSLVPTADVRSQTFEARIDLPVGATENWTVGQLVSVAVPIRSAQLALTVPRDALVLRQGGTFVFRINGESKAEQVEVEVGDSAGAFVAVTGALSSGDRVAIRGAENLRDGAEVRVLVSEVATSIVRSY